MSSQEQDYTLACRMHSEALWCYHILLGGGRNGPGGEEALKTAEWNMKFRGWTNSQVSSHRFDHPSLPHKCPKGEKGGSFLEGTKSMEAVRQTLKALERKFAAPEPAAEDVARSWNRGILGQLLGTAFGEAYLAPSRGGSQSRVVEIDVPDLDDPAGEFGPLDWNA